MRTTFGQLSEHGRALKNCNSLSLRQQQEHLNAPVTDHSMKLIVALCFAAASALAPAPVRPQTVARRDIAATLGAAAAAVALPLAAVAEGEVPSQVAAPDEAPAAPAEFPKDWGLNGDYYTDAAKVVGHMRLATGLEKGAPNMELIALNCKKEMIDFVSFYRRFTNVSGKQSFSTLYTAINVLAGHYTSYGPKFPVPEKRRKRLFQEYAEIEKNIKKRR